MVSHKTLKAYKFESIEDYFEYIIESKINGQHAQVLSLVKAMSKEQKKHYLIWDKNQRVSEHLAYCKSIVIQEM